jgi:dihydrofolate synthase/folylpolyglutamate synthase
MDYPQTIDYLFTRLPMFSRLGSAAMNEGLTNAYELCEACGNPQLKFKSVHVGGTNGKGSTSHMLAAILQSAGYRTGLYTSPHLKDFRERIKVDGKIPDESFITGFVEKLRPLIEFIQPSFFEITVAMAFTYFAEQEVDIAIIEVGLGGRLDSTNIIFPELSVITNISFDHMNILGNTLQKIAYEKAGIIKKNTPVVIGQYQEDIREVFEQTAKEQEAPLNYANRNHFVASWEMEKHELIAEVTSVHNNEKNNYRLDLPGLYQMKNLVTVLETVRQLRLKGWAIPEAQVHSALNKVRKITGFNGRWEIISDKPLIVLDVGHNEDGIRQILEQIEITDHEQLHIITGFVKDKDLDKILSILPRQALYYFTRAHIPRALPEDELLEKARSVGLKGEHFPGVNEAILAARQRCSERDMILVCGSVFVIGEIE